MLLTVPKKIKKTVKYGLVRNLLSKNKPTIKPINIGVTKL